MRKYLIAVALVSCASVAWANPSLVYDNPAAGVRLTGPQGWSMTPGDTIDELVNKAIDSSPAVKNVKKGFTRKWGVLVAFTKLPFGATADANSMLTLTAEQVNLPADKYTPLNYATLTLMDFRKNFPGVKMLQGPLAIKIGGKNAAMFEYECAVAVQGKSVMSKGAMYFFLKGKRGFTLACSDKADAYVMNKKLFEAAVQSFVLK
jgi:hypothetical protein